jgi:hypothetical protein
MMPLQVDPVDRGARIKERAFIGSFFMIALKMTKLFEKSRFLRHTVSIGIQCLCHKSKVV